MNETPETAANTDGGGVRQMPDQGDEDPSPSTGATAAAERPSFIEWLSTLFRHRNGNTLREDLSEALAETGTGDQESFSPAERAMLHNILRLREVRVEDVMVPRADIEGIEITTTLGDLLTIFEQSGHSRMPVYAETLDDPRGMVHFRDVLAHITRAARVKNGRGSRKSTNGTGAPAPTAPLDLANVDLTKTLGELNLIRTVLFVPPSMLASDLMARMQASRTQMALVIDEYGGTDGLASLEDIVEMVVGDIEDEHDESVPLITQAGDGIYVVDAKAEIDEVAKLIGDAFSPGEHGEYVDTIGGLIFNALGRVPARGEVVHAVPGFEFHVLDADPRRVKRVRIVELKNERRRRAAKEQAEHGEPGFPGA
jgi:CBS domain containing-hemolysin-like protein